jgi:DNA-binding transcriptional regulator YiaG
MTAAQISNFLHRHKMSAEDLADAIGVTNSAVRHWVEGTRTMPEVEVRVMRLFDADPRFIPYFKSLGGTR